MNVSEKDVDELYQTLKRDAERSGYHLNPDTAFTRELVRGLLANAKRYGYPSCPCRLAAGRKEMDLDIICPCDYRDPDLTEHGMCYCALYVSGRVLTGGTPIHSIPERRLPPEERAQKRQPQATGISALPLPVWRCKVCGYLCAREQPPEVCPICQAKQERFERFM